MAEWSEAYLEGMKTRPGSSRRGERLESEAYLEGMKTVAWIEQQKTRLSASEAYLEGMKT